MKFTARNLFIWGGLIAVFILFRLISSKLFIEETIWVFPFYVFFIYWGIFPYLTGSDMFTSLGQTLKRGEDDVLRNILLIACIIACLFVMAAPKGS